MLSVKSLLFLGLLSAATALPTSLSTRQANGAICGGNSYSADDISAAQQQGCQLQSQGQAIGHSKYPHKYNDYEGFSFQVNAPWYEFPILSGGGVYSGSSPGADRVIFNDQCELAGVLTHTGASGNNFVQCQYN